MSAARKSSANRAARTASREAREPVLRLRRPQDPRQERHPGLDVREEHLGHRNARKDVRHRRDPGGAARAAERRAERQHADAGGGPVQRREDPDRERKRQRREQRARRIERARVGVGRERPAPRDFGCPDRKAAAGPRVVDALLERQVVGDQIAAAEVPADKERIGIQKTDESRKEHGVAKPHAAARKGRGHDARRRRAIARSSTTPASGPYRETSRPGAFSRHSIVWEPAGTGTAVKASCAGCVSTG